MRGKRLLNIVGVVMAALLLTACAKTIALPVPLSDYETWHSAALRSELESLGFSDITMQMVENERGNEYNDVVANVTIGGESDLPASAEVSSDDPVVVQFYGSYSGSGEPTDTGSSKTTDSSTTEAKANPEGIIVYSYEKGDYRFPSNDYDWDRYSFTAKLDMIDPETGEVTNLRTFSSENTKSCYATEGILNLRSPDISAFSDDLTKMVARTNLSDGSKHVGWIDETGAFTDVTAKLETEKSDFAGITDHGGPQFFGDYFYFYDHDTATDNTEIKRVPIDNLSPDAVEVMDDDATYNTWSVNEDGSVWDSPSAHSYYDESLSYFADAPYGDWVSVSKFVGNGNSETTIYLYDLEGQTNEGFDGWYSSRTSLIPEAKNRMSANPRVSPDGSEVAFLSKLNEGSEENQSIELFIVPIGGGDPTKVNTSYDFSESALIDWM